MDEQTPLRGLQPYDEPDEEPNDTRDAEPNSGLDAAAGLTPEDTRAGAPANSLDWEAITPSSGRSCVRQLAIIEMEAGQPVQDGLLAPKDKQPGERRPFRSAFPIAAPRPYLA